MPRLPKERNLDHCLRKLRIRLGPRGQPMSQAKLAQILKVSTETIKSLESGRLRKGIPSEEMMDRIITEFGAAWVEERKEWDFLTRAPFTRANYELWKSATFDRAAEIDTLCGGLISLLGRVSDQRFPSASDAVYRCLHEIAKQHDVSWMDTDFFRMDIAIVNVWRDGKNTGNPSDIIGFRRERDFEGEPLNRTLGDFSAKLQELKATPVKPPSRRRSKQAAAVESPKTSSPQPP